MSFLDELYYGNINPNENRNRKKLPYEKALKTFSDIESKLTKELNGENLKLFNELVNASDEISATSGIENFKIGFRLGVMMMCDTLSSQIRLSQIICTPRRNPSLKFSMLVMATISSLALIRSFTRCRGLPFNIFPSSFSLSQNFRIVLA